MPFILHRPDAEEPSNLIENDARRVIKTNFPDTEVQNNVWSKSLKGERVSVQPGQLEWISDATV